MTDDKLTDLRKLSQGKPEFVGIFAKDLCDLVDKVNKAACDPEKLEAFKQAADHNKGNPDKVVIATKDLAHLVAAMPQATPTKKTDQPKGDAPPK